MVHLVNFSPVRRTPKHTDFHDDPIPLTNVTVPRQPAAEGLHRKGPLRRHGPARSVRRRRGVEFLVPRVDIHEVVCLEMP
jgi:hypothetical protein